MAKLITSFMAGILFCLFIMAFLLNGCGDTHQALPESTHTVKTVTKYLKGKTDTIYLEKKNPIASSSIPSSVSDQKKNWCDSLRFYSDTTQIDSTSKLVANDSIVGKKKWSSRLFIGTSYTKIVETTITDSIPYPVNIPTYSVWLTGGAGVGPVYNSLFVGVDCFGKKKWGYGYDYDVIQKIHRGKVHYLLFRK